ncbi:ATP-binding SpoIIE family protein phosphatase [Pseudobacteroides cellulosolvens]|uniref:Putative anti-sigma regulatory factor, serine/threonine protein kinase n=1 Tax=Pseudobacteroides cellulosolvens ATCC 35603 = DSM 2933 TaxID=398512 RepID=A0A0L6JKQ7_9FIRM|nr:ATP-binding SpoIIE family protein phosphatase [Pseudobacteroides cellulosolvens]KNY26293.1 putative anti-sigma regulatory factor, serine/threonine protein kinase [Pseudobacteroides cellulosolvens ATCC 35603 = DSM 2933]
MIDILDIRGDYDIGTARRSITQICSRLGFNEREVGEISIVVTELCTNIIKHNAVDGKVIVTEISEGGRMGIEITVEDKGPGIADVDEVIRDGFSTKGTMGTGLGAVKRLMDSFEIYSNIKDSKYLRYPFEEICAGTVVTVKKWLNCKLDPYNNDIKVSVMSRPYPGFNINGDSYYVKHLNDKEIIAVIDGLGHGNEAHKASTLAARTIEHNYHKNLTEIIFSVNDALKQTRGAAMGIVVIDKFKNEFEYSSIGNIDIRYVSEDRTEIMMPTNGILGSKVNSIKTYKRFYKSGAAVVMCSDGISTRWDIRNYPGILLKNPAILSNTIMRDFGKETDDATVLVAFI